MLVGYLILPALIAEKLGFDDLLVKSQPKITVDHKRIEKVEPGGGERIEKVEPAGGFEPDGSFGGLLSSNIQESVYEMKSKPIRNIQIEDIQNKAQDRVVENQKLYGSQSMPTTTTPHIMVTPKLPDAKRMKIMVTGGTYT